MALMWWLPGHRYKMPHPVQHSMKRLKAPLAYSRYTVKVGIGAH
jgi:hypothetical protein